MVVKQLPRTTSSTSRSRHDVSAMALVGIVVVLCVQKYHTVTLQDDRAIVHAYMLKHPGSSVLLLQHGQLDADTKTALLRDKPLVAVTRPMAQLTHMGAVVYKRGKQFTFYYFPARVIRCFWTDTTPMSADRKACLQNMRATCGVHIELYTHDTIPHLELPGAPFHGSYKHLSAVHKCDFLRTYCMNFYGGGYCDIKHQTGDWNAAFEELETSPDVWIVGYREVEGGVGYAPHADKWNVLVGNGAYICRKQTALTKEWYSAMRAKLDEKQAALSASPAKHARDCAEKGGGYPVAWVEMLGEIFHRVILSHIAHVRYSLPSPDFSKKHV